MFGNKLKKEVEEIKEKLFGPDFFGYSFKKPASYSLVEKINSTAERQYKNERIINMLLDELGFTIVEETGTRLIKKRKARK